MVDIEPHRFTLPPFPSPNRVSILLRRYRATPWGGVKLVDGAKTVRGKACSFVGPIQNDLVADRGASVVLFSTKK